MRYLLVMPKQLGAIDHFNIFPIGLAYVSAALKEAGHDVVTANLDYLEEDTTTALGRLIHEKGIDVVCTGGLSRDYSKLKELVDVARNAKQDILVVIGGGIISSDPEPAMSALGADLGVIGEGEITMCELAEALDAGLSYRDISGLIFKAQEGSYSITKPRQEIMDIDTIPFPDFEGFGYDRWVKSSGAGVILTDRSCPFRCTFCFHPSGEKYRQRSFDNIFEEIDHQIEHYHIKSIGFSSELFATTKKRILEFCERMKTYQLSWGCALRVTDVDSDVLQALRESGCINLVFGLESMDDRILKSMRKGITRAQIDRALKLTYEANIMIEGGFIFGDKNETLESVNNTLRYWRDHNDKHYLNLTMISVFPGSQLYKDACDAGIIQDRVQFLKDGCPLVNVSRLTDTEYRWLHSTITELRLHPHVPAGAFRIGDVHLDGACIGEFSCRKCRTETQVQVPFWFGMEQKCPTCGLVNLVDPFRYSLLREDHFFEALGHGSKVALWGAGGVFYKIAKQYGPISEPRFVLVDGNPALCGLNICGKEVHTPDRLCSPDLDTVIITALSRKDEIRRTIRNDFPSIRRILVPDFEKTDEGVIPVLKDLAET